MLKREYEGQERCSVAMTLELVGERWTWLIIRDAFLGLTRFAEFRESLGIAGNVLSDRLNRLDRRGRLRARRRTATARRGTSTVLTGKGRDLFTALNALRQWGDEHLSDAPMRLLRTRDGGTPVVAALVPQGTPALAARRAGARAGPGLPAELRSSGRGMPPKTVEIETPHGPARAHLHRVRGAARPRSCSGTARAAASRRPTSSR